MIRRMLDQGFRVAIAALAMFAATAAAGHEFWMLPDKFEAPAGATVSLTLSVGENFVGDRVAFSQPLLAAFHRYTSTGKADLRPRVAANGPVGELTVSLPRAGTHLLAIDTHPSEIILAAEKFNAYLHDEGLDFIIEARQAAGTADSPGRERYRRNIKTLVQAGAGDATFSRRTGQRLEIVPLTDPQQHAGGRPMAFQVLFEGRPLPGALVKFWRRQDRPALPIKQIANAQGKVTVTPPQPGVWMASVVHMIPATGTRDHDWDSFWGNLTFALPSR